MALGVFISAKSEDYEHALQVYEFLKGRGVRAFFSAESLPELGIADYRKEIDRELEDAEHMVVVASRAEHVRSLWVEAEWGFFINEKRSGRKPGNLLTLAVGGLQPKDLPPSLRCYEVVPFDAKALQKILRYVVPTAKPEPKASDGPPESSLPAGWRAEERRVTVATPEGDVEKAVTYCTNTVGMEFVLIPAGGTVVRSVRKSGKGKAVRKAYRVRITKPFYMGAHPVTVGAFQQFVQSTGYETEGERGKGSRTWNWADRKWVRSVDTSWRTPGYDQDGMSPVVCISWNDSVKFAAWLSGKEDSAYRLPTETEWEYSCRAGTKSMYYWGNEFREDCAWAGVNSGRRPRPVGEKLPNAFGLHDMSGNVWEWCEDWFSSDYVPSASNPQGPISGEARSIRGASWWNAASNCKSANRFMQPPWQSGVLGGVRIACTAPE